MHPDHLIRMTLKDLRALAERHGLSGSVRWRKDQLIGALSALPHAVISTAPLSAPTSMATGSSSTAAPSPAPAHHPLTDQGLPIPASYGVDRLVLLVQDPLHVFAYWEISAETYAKVAAEAGPGHAQVLLLHGPHGSEQREIDLIGGNYYLSVAPNTTYRAELALRGKDGRLHRLAWSNPASTPAAAPSATTEAEWMEVDGAFGELLAIAGGPGSDSSSLARLSTRTLSGRTLGIDELAQRGLSSSDLSRRAAAHLNETLSSTTLSSTSLSSTALSSTELAHRP